MSVFFLNEQPPSPELCVQADSKESTIQSFPLTFAVALFANLYKLARIGFCASVALIIDAIGRCVASATQHDGGAYNSIPFIHATRAILNQQPGKKTVNLFSS